MTRFYDRLLALVLAGGMLMIFVLSPSEAVAQKPPAGANPAKPAAPAKTSPAKTAPAKTAPAKTAPVKTVPARPAVPAKRAIPAQRAVPAKPAMPKSATPVKRAVPAKPAVPAKRAVPARRAVPAKPARAVNIVKVKTVSARRIQEIGRLKPVIHHVTVQRVVLQHIKLRHAKLRNVTFVTGTVVRKGNGVIVLREPDGDEVPVAVRTVVLNPRAFAPGTVVVVPAQFVNSGFVLVPAFTRVDEDDFVAAPAVAPCALNDRDADDGGATSTFAPVGACMSNDGDADDGFTFAALPPSFNPPTVFSNAFVPVLASGFVVSQVGSNVVLMTSNFTPIVVNASAAISAGATNGALTPGRFVTVYGFNINNQFVATSFV